MTVLENLNRLTGQSIVDISRRAVLIVRLLEIRREPADREIPRQLLHAVLGVRKRMTGRARKQHQQHEREHPHPEPGKERPPLRLEQAAIQSETPLPLSSPPPI